MCENLRI